MISRSFCSWCFRQLNRALLFSCQFKPQVTWAKPGSRSPPNTTAIISLIKLHFVLSQLIWRISSSAMLSIRFFFSKIYPYNSLNMSDTWVINAYIFSTFKRKYNIFVDVFLCFKYVHRTDVIFYFHFNDKNIKKSSRQKQYCSILISLLLEITWI